MKTTEMDCKINGLHVTEVEIKRWFGNAPPVMKATYATIERQDRPGKTTLLNSHGRCTADPTNVENPWAWSKETLHLMEELLKSMEYDLMPRHFRLPDGMERDDEKKTESGGLEEVDQV